MWAIRRVCLSRSLWPNLLKLLDAEIRLSHDPALSAELYVEKGQLLEDKLRDEAGAKAAFERAVEEDPTSLPALMSLEKIITREGDIGALGRIFRRMASATAEPERRVALLLDLARLQSALVDGSTETAMALLREAWEVGADRERVLDEIERVAEAAGRTEDLLAALDDRAALYEARPDSGEAIAAVRRRQARLVRDDGARAWGYVKQGIERLPDEPLLLADLTELAESLGRMGELADVLERRVALATPAARPGLLFDRSRALRRAGRDTEADATERELESTAPSYALLLHQRARRALASGDMRNLATLYRAEGEWARDGLTATGEVDARWAAGAFAASGAAWERTGETAAAIDAHRAAISVEAGYRPSVDALDRLLDRAGLHADRDALLSSQLAGAAGSRSEEIIEALIELRLDRLHDLEGAIALADALCELRGGDAASRVRLIELLRAARRWEEAADHLGRLAETFAATGAIERAAEAKLERADLMERRLGRVDEAAAGFDEVARALPTHPRAAVELSRILRAHGRHARLAEALRREIDNSLRPERADRLLVELGELLWRPLDRADEAAEIFRTLLDRSPGHPVALRLLTEIYEATGDRVRLAETLESAVESNPSPEAQAITLLRLGEVYEDRGETELADDAFARAIEKSGPGASAKLIAHAAFGRFRALARRRENGLLDSVLGELQRQTDSASCAALAEERAWLVGGVGGDLDAAAQRLANTAAEADPLVLISRLRLAARNGDVVALGDGLEALGRRSVDRQLSSALLLRSGALAAAMGRPASTRLADALSNSDGDPKAVLVAADFTDEPAVISRRIDLAEGTSMIDWIIEHAESLASRARLGEAAAEVLRGLEIAPRHVGLLDLARRLAAAGGDRNGEARALARLAFELADPARSAAHFAEAARLFTSLGAPEEAILAWRAVLARTPLDDEAYRRVHELIVATEDTGALDQLLEARIAATLDGPRRVELLVERADLHARANRCGAARSGYRAALDLDPSHLGALRRLGDRLAADGDQPGAIAVFESFVEIATDGATLRPVRFKLADLHEAGGAIADAVRHLRGALVIAPADVELMERLIALHLAQKDFSAVAVLLKTRAATAVDTRERAALEIRLADLYRDHVRDLDAEREAIGRALDAEPLAMEALARFVPLCERAGEKQFRDSVLARATAEASRMIAKEPLAVGPYRSLEQILSWCHDDDVAIATQAASLMAGEPPPAREGDREPVRELTVASWELAMGPIARGAALDIWRDLPELTAKIFGPEISQLGVEKSDRQNAKGIPSAWIPVDKIARSLGAGSYELYRSSQGRDVARTVGAALVLGSAHAEKLTSIARFRVARKVILLRDRLGPVEATELPLLELFFAACARTVGVTWIASSSPSEAKLEERTKAVKKAIDRKTKKLLESKAGRFAAIGDLGAWRRAILLGAAKLGLAVAGDLGAALAELKLDVRSDDGMQLVRFALSDDIRAIRRELGLRG